MPLRESLNFPLTQRHNTSDQTAIGYEGPFSSTSCYTRIAALSNNPCDVPQQYPLGKGRPEGQSIATKSRSAVLFMLVGILYGSYGSTSGAIRSKRVFDHHQIHVYDILDVAYPQAYCTTTTDKKMFPNREDQRQMEENTRQKSKQKNANNAPIHRYHE